MLVSRLNGSNLLDNFLTVHHRVMSNVDSLLSEIRYRHDAQKRKLFIDSPKTSLKTMLLHIGNKKPSIYFIYKTQMNKSYVNIEDTMSAKLLGLKLEYEKNMLFSI